MDYEARLDARNDHDSQVAHEERQGFESELDGIIEGAIEAGDHDVAVLQRAAAILREHGFPYRELDHIVEELKAK